MKIQLKRDEDLLEINRLVIYIGADKYRLQESVDGKLNINKCSDDDDLIRVHPRSGNEIELS